MIKVKDNVIWTGYVDWNLRNFHGYSTPSGSTYNAYLILDDKPVLIDTVKSEGFKEMLLRIKQAVNPSEIQYIISNHSELDHSGSIGLLLDYCPEAEIVCSANGAKCLSRYFKKKWRFKIVETGDTLNIGKRNLKFYLTPMLHWPDSMMTYLKEDQILFSNDAFGQHYASSERFVDEAGLDIAFCEAAKYYANILTPYGIQVQKALGELGGLNIDKICPSHGLIWRRGADIDTIISLYDKWCNYLSAKRVAIIYHTMWHSTELIAKTLYEFLDREDIPAALINLQITDISDVITEIMNSRVVALGSSILNNKILPQVGALLAYLEGLKPKNRSGFTFGSYGWSKVGFKELEDSLKKAGINLISEGKYFQYLPEKEELDSLELVALKIKELLK